jgi:hypothetical protein
MQGYLLLKKSQAAWDEREGLRMLTLAQAAHDGPWQLPPLVQAEVAQQEARGLAMTGESSATVEAKLNEAWEVFTGAEATMSELGPHYDRALLTMQTAICYCEAGRPGQAAQLYREHLDDEQISHRDRGYSSPSWRALWHTPLSQITQLRRDTRPSPLPLTHILCAQFMNSSVSAHFLSRGGRNQQCTNCARPCCLVATDPVRHGTNDPGLPLLTLRIGVTRIVVDSKTVLSALDLKEPMLGRQLLDCPAG